MYQNIIKKVIYNYKVVEMENKIKFLEIIQNIITRMSSNCFMLKGWTVTLVAGVFALSSKESNSMFFLIAYVPVILFWFLDSYYLQLERKYRKLYNIIIQKDYSEIDFNIVILPSSFTDKTYFVQSLLSCTEIGFYLPTALLIVVVILISSISI